MVVYVLKLDGDIIEFPNANHWKTRNGWVKIRESRHGNSFGVVKSDNIVGVFTSGDFNVLDNNTNGV